MTKTYTQHFREQASSTSGEDVVYLAEISHPALAESVRIANDTQDVYHLGNRFVSCPFRIQFPDDMDQALPRASVSVDNVGRVLTSWLEVSRGGKGAEARIMQVMRDKPDTVEQEYTLTLLNVKQNVMEVTADLGYENFMDIPCLAALYDPERCPGIF